MIKILSRIISILIIACIALIAIIELYPEQVKEAESKLWISIVVPIQDLISDMKEKLDEARDKDYQRDIEDIVNNEITQ